MLLEKGLLTVKALSRTLMHQANWTASSIKERQAGSALLL
jgi:hypothetical protein